MLSNPRPLADAMRSLRRVPVVYPITVNPPDAFEEFRQAATLAEFFEMLQSSSCGPLKIAEPTIEDTFV